MGTPRLVFDPRVGQARLASFSVVGLKMVDFESSILFEQICLGLCLCICTFSGLGRREVKGFEIFRQV